MVSVKESEKEKKLLLKPQSRNLHRLCWSIRNSFLPSCLAFETWEESNLQDSEDSRLHEQEGRRLIDFVGSVSFIH